MKQNLKPSEAIEQLGLFNQSLDQNFGSGRDQRRIDKDHKVYFDTTHLGQSEVIERTNKAITQNEIVLDLFKKHRKLTPQMCFEILLHQSKINANTPLTSIRRSISVLTKQEHLEKLEEKRIGSYGASEYFWQYRNEAFENNIKVAYRNYLKEHEDEKLAYTMTFEQFRNHFDEGGIS